MDNKNYRIKQRKRARCVATILACIWLFPANTAASCTVQEEVHDMSKKVSEAIDHIATLAYPADISYLFNVADRDLLVSSLIDRINNDPAFSVDSDARGNALRALAHIPDDTGMPWIGDERQVQILISEATHESRFMVLALVSMCGIRAPFQSKAARALEPLLIKERKAKELGIAIECYGHLNHSSLVGMQRLSKIAFDPETTQKLDFVVVIHVGDVTFTRRESSPHIIRFKSMEARLMLGAFATDLPRYRTLDDDGQLAAGEVLMNKLIKTKGRLDGVEEHQLAVIRFIRNVFTQRAQFDAFQENQAFALMFASILDESKNSETVQKEAARVMLKLAAMKNDPRILDFAKSILKGYGFDPVKLEHDDAKSASK